jgi:hypothetical protein
LKVGEFWIEESYDLIGELFFFEELQVDDD